MSDRAGGPPSSTDDDDIWVDEPVPAGGPARPPRRGGPARPPRRGGAAPVDRDDEPVPATPIAGGPVLDDGHDYVELPREGRLPRWLGVLIVFALLAGVLVGGAWWWYQRQIDPPGSPGATVSVTVPQGSSTSGIGSILERQGVIPNAMVFSFYAGRQDAGPFEAGVYELRENSDLDLVLDTLAAGPTAPVTAQVVKVSIPEGLTTAALLARVTEQVPRFTPDALQAALTDGTVTTTLRPDGQTSWEGLLFPATYDVGASETAGEFLVGLSDEMETRVAGLDLPAAQARIEARYGIDLSAYELLTVASLVQAEAGNPDEAPKIAAVIYNRMAEGWALGIDATSKYGAELEGTDIDYESESPYNTRRRPGLPPTPIAAPGDFALDAAADPAEGPWMYYVLTEERAHTFVVTEAEFAAAKQICIDKNLGCG